VARLERFEICPVRGSLSVQSALQVSIAHSRSSPITEARGSMRRTRYQLLADDLIERITSGELPVGSRVPSEYDLCAQHDLSRGTVRQALRCLEDLGMITRSTLGTTVTAAHPVDAYHPNAGTADEIMDLVARTRLWRPKSAEILADEELAARLDVDVGSHWYSLVGPLVSKSDPSVRLCWSEHYHATDEGRTMLRHGEFSAEGVETLLTEQVISAEPMREEPARALGAEPGSAALVVRRTHIDDSGVLVKVSLHTHRGDSFKIKSITRGHVSSFVS
jgi:GntR family transcriptional regulator